ncbi:uncharacterized protein N7498_001563 [Penicillium cinerascens]|uniref:Uncharacterized protein n=1 Tax=Penicillium cinerascens TaxID=70096 RepID=A0A9W9NGC9_9EURO|nr:uncharacterized protein N7498_001563 [Penicillium cinerascens]KAJ5219464.1 hypothetical protein N7498_001563 [Penicillium cinerascens]
MPRNAPREVRDKQGRNSQEKEAIFQITQSGINLQRLPQKESPPGAAMKAHKIPDRREEHLLGHQSPPLHVREAQAVPQDLNDSSSDDEIIVPSSQRRNRRVPPMETHLSMSPS